MSTFEGISSFTALHIMSAASSASFLFLTDNTGSAYKRSAGSGKTSYIVMYDANSNAASILVNGDF